MMILAILQARVSSKRLPRKVLAPILGKPMLLRQIERIRRAPSINALIVATSTAPEDDAIATLCQDNQIDCFRGDLNDVLDRFHAAAMTKNPQHIVRLTGDCPLADPEVIEQAIALHLRENADFTSNALEPTYPDGLDVEVVRRESLERAWREAKLPSEREHVTPYLFAKPGAFRIVHLKGEKNLSHLRWTVDTPEDFELIDRVFQALYPKNKNFSQADILNFLEENPSVMEINKNLSRNEGLLKSQEKDRFSQRYKHSEKMLEQALKTIPLGSQTFSKSKTQYPHGVSPFFITRAKGARAWDVDGNEYVDFINALCSVNLGHCDPDVTAAVKNQLEYGTIFSLPHPLEAQVAEKIVELIPCAEKVRFGKNGSDTTSAAIRLARAYTRRDRVICCGYHGWQDWYIGSTARNLGVPKAVSDLTLASAYGYLDSFQKHFQNHPGEIAAVIIEPMNTTEPPPGFLASLRELCHKNGALLIFDETITGFRFAKGGAQELFGVTPDLATFGKGIANGYPLSAITGKAEIMDLMSEIFFSTTFGGETLSLAAALATMKKIEQEPVIAKLYETGTKLAQAIRAKISNNALSEVLSVAGNPTWTFLTVKDTPVYTQWQIKTFLLQELFARGVLSTGTHNISYAHGEADLRQIINAYEEILPILAAALSEKNLEKRLHALALEPLFKVR